MNSNVDLVKALFHNKRYDAVSEFARINGDRKDKLIITEYVGGYVSTYCEDDGTTKLYVPKDITTFQENAVAEAINNGTLFEDAKDVTNNATMIERMTLPHDAMTNRFGEGPSQGTKTIICIVLGKMNPEGSCKVTDADRRNGINFIKDIASKDEKGVTTQDVVDNYLEKRPEDFNGPELGSKVFDLDKDAKKLKDITPEDSITDADCVDAYGDTDIDDLEEAPELDDDTDDDDEAPSIDDTDDDDSDSDEDTTATTDENDVEDDAEDDMEVDESFYNEIDGEFFQEGSKQENRLKNFLKRHNYRPSDKTIEIVNPTKHTKYRIGFTMDGDVNHIYFMLDSVRLFKTIKNIHNLSTETVAKFMRINIARPVIQHLKPETVDDLFNHEAGHALQILTSPSKIGMNISKSDAKKISKAFTTPEDKLTDAEIDEVVNILSRQKNIVYKLQEDEFSKYLAKNNDVLNEHDKLLTEVDADENAIKMSNDHKRSTAANMRSAFTYIENKNANETLKSYVRERGVSQYQKHQHQQLVKFLNENKNNIFDNIDRFGDELFCMSRISGIFGGTKSISGVINKERDMFIDGIHEYETSLKNKKSNGATPDEIADMCQDSYETLHSLLHQFRKTLLGHASLVEGDCEYCGDRVWRAVALHKMPSEFRESVNVYKHKMDRDSFNDKLKNHIDKYNASVNKECRPILKMLDVEFTDGKSIPDNIFSSLIEPIKRLFDDAINKCHELARQVANVYIWCFQNIKPWSDETYSTLKQNKSANIVKTSKSSKARINELMKKQTAEQKAFEQGITDLKKKSKEKAIAKKAAGRGREARRYKNQKALLKQANGVVKEYYFTTKHIQDLVYTEGFLSKKPKKLKPIPRDVVAYITCEMNDIRSANDQAMLSGYTCSKIELVDFYLTCIDTQDPRYIVPHSKQYLDYMKRELERLLTQILNIRPINRSEQIWRVNYPTPSIQ